MKLTCSKCFGNKTYRGMGSMIVKCEPCDGIGHVVIKAELPAAAAAEDKPVSKKTRNVNSGEKRNASKQTD